MSSPPSAPPGAASAKKPGDPPRAPIVRLDRWRGAVQILSLGGGLIEHGLTLRVDHQAVASIDLARAHDVATAGFNLLANPDFSQFSALWKPEVPGDGASACGLDLAPEWTLQGSHTAFLGTFVGPPQGRGRLCYVDPFYGAWLPISDKQRYLFRARVGTHRCTAHLSAELRNAAGEIRLIAGPPLDAARAGGRTLAGYHDAQLEIAPRAGESALRLSIAKSDTIEGADSFLFLAHPAFGLKPKSEHFSIPNAAVDEVLRGTIIGLVAAGKPVNVVTVPLPKDCYDGREHTIEVIGPHGEPLAAPQAFQRADASYGQIESFDGFELRGSVPTKPNQVIGRLQLRIDEDVVETVSVLDQTRDRIAFTAKIPPRYLDGRPHLFVVLGPANHPLAAAAGLTACHLTPWADLEAHASLPLPAARSPRAMSHLENLDRLHRAYARACQDKTTAKLSALRHRLHEAALAHAELGLPWERRRIFPKLAFPAVRSPTVSVVIPCHNNWKATYHCLTALKFAHSEATFEVIIVDDGSTDETATLEAMVKGVKVVRNASALGFVHACNRGAAAARGRFIAFLNNDTEVTGRWLDEMALLFETYPSVGLVGSKLLFPDGRLQEAGGVVWQSGNPTNYGRLENPEDPRFCYVRQIDYASGASIMVDRAVWKTVGGFSEIFAPAYFEDTDLAFKIRAAGYATLYAPHSVVYHFEGLSSGPATSGGMKRFQEVNRPKFKQTWARAYRSAGIEGENIDLEKDRNIARRCLMIDYQIPRPDLDAGSYAAIQEIRLLQSLGYKVTFLPQNTLYLGGYVSLLQRLGVEVVYAPFALGVAEFLSRRGAEFDLIYITRYAVARAVIDDAREHSPRAKIVLNVADLHFLRELRAALPARQPDEMRRVELIREEELDAIRRVDLALSYSEVERRLIAKETGGAAKVALCPWVVDIHKPAPFEERRDIAFLGSFDHPPNAQAVGYFVEEVMPRLREQAPGVKFVIYGSAAEARLKHYAASDVVIAGWIDDVDKVYASCRIFIAPLVSGAGIKGKVISALAHGVPQILTPIAAEATGIRDGVEALIADTPGRWAEAVGALYNDRARWQAMSAAALRLASRYSFEAGRTMMAQALEEVGLPSPPAPGLTTRSGDIGPLFDR